MKWNKKIKAKMWAEMVTDHIKQQQEIDFTKTIARYCVAIGGVFLLCIWSLYFVFQL